MGAGTGKAQFGFDYGHKILIEVGVYFKPEIQSNILLWPKILANISVFVLINVYI